jgi:hypothetical protein
MSDYGFTGIGTTGCHFDGVELRPFNEHEIKQHKYNAIQPDKPEHDVVNICFMNGLWNTLYGGK